MDFIDSLVLEDAAKQAKKAHRVRSWLLCEQYYKYLESSKVDAALNQPKFYQDTILERELYERRARRRSCDAGLCPRDGRDESRLYTSTTISCEDFECLQDDDSEVEVAISQHVNIDNNDLDSNLDDTVIDADKDSCTSKASRSDVRSNDDVTEAAESALNAAESVLHAEESAVIPADRERELKEKLEEITNTIMEDIKLQMKSDNFNYTEPEIRDCDEESLVSVEHMKQCKELESLYDTSVQNIWAKLVSFAYQLIQQNHGNSYYDYSSQFLTAVLAFDVLRRGFNKMWHILQPYVSPIKFECDQPSCSEQKECFVKRKKSSVPHKCCRKPSQFKRLLPHNLRKKNKACNRMCSNDVPSQPCCFGDAPYTDSIHGWELYSLEKSRNRCLQSSEPWQEKSIAEHRTDKEYEQSQIGHHACNCEEMWPEQRRDDLELCSYRTVVRNPMLRIANRLDSILKEIDDSGF